jgi:beta-glucosidase
MFMHNDRLLHNAQETTDLTAFRFAVALAAVSAGILLSQSGNPAPPAPVTGNPKVDKLLAQMTLAEKISMIHGSPEDPSTSQGQPGYVAGVPRLGIPPLRLVDGPAGVLTKVWSTGMTSTMGLAATFSREDALHNGEVIGGDARALGQDVVLEPFLNLLRDFTFTRGYNTYGEDPLLTGQIGAAVVTGIQSRGVMSAAKHYTAFDGGTNVAVDAQTLHELYVAPFADAVDAGIAAVLCSSNTINGLYSCGSGATLNTILKGELAFKGFVIPDFQGTHSTLYINEGLDLAMPGGVEGVTTGVGGYFLATTPTAAPTPGRGRGGNAGRGPAGGMPEERNTSPVTGGGGGRGPAADTELPIGMLHAVETGQVKEATITAAVGRILGRMDKFGYLDKPPSHDVAPEDYTFNEPVLRKTAEDAAVLLRNRDNVLPLTTADLDSVAFIGPGAGQTVAIGLPGGKGPGIPAHQTGTVAAIAKIAGKNVTFAVANDMTGTPIPASALSATDGPLDFTESNGRALPAGTSRNWAGKLNVPADGSYMLALQVLGAAASLTLDGQTILRTGTPAPGRGAILHPNQDNILPTVDGLDNSRTLMTLKAGPHDLAVTATGEQAGHPVQIRLAWVTPEQRHANYDAAIAAAKSARKAVVFAWGRDRPEPFHLPGDQDKLIEDIAAANPNTIVVLNTSLPVAMPWLEKVKAVVQMWWPGDEGGPATANVLLGRTNPAGRLPFTWPRNLDQMVANDPAHPERSSRGVDGKTSYSEGIFMGYRWFDREKLEPLFPFGYGLSYSSFVYSKPKVMRASDGGLDVSFTLRNTGKVGGDEVPQVYLGPPTQAPADAQFAVKALAAFDRVRVEAGQSNNVSLHVPLRRLQYWSTSEGKWVTAIGTRTLYVSASSRDVRLTVPAQYHRTK